MRRRCGAVFSSGRAYKAKPGARMRRGRIRVLKDTDISEDLSSLRRILPALSCPLGKRSMVETKPLSVVGKIMSHKVGPAAPLTHGAGQGKRDVSQFICTMAGTGYEARTPYSVSPGTN